MRKLLRRLPVLGRRLTTILPVRQHGHPLPQAVHHDTPAYIHRGRDGWEVLTPGGIRVHCFTPWYDECRLLPGGHAELLKKRPAGPAVYRFRWCIDTKAYTPDHPVETTLGHTA